MKRFSDRTIAGKVLAASLKQHAGRNDFVVLVLCAQTTDGEVCDLLAKAAERRKAQAATG